jgi:hypothetical protein
VLVVGLGTGDGLGEAGGVLVGGVLVGGVLVGGVLVGGVLVGGVLVGGVLVGDVPVAGRRVSGRRRRGVGRRAGWLLTVGLGEKEPPAIGRISTVAEVAKCLIEAAAATSRPATSRPIMKRRKA